MGHARQHRMKEAEEVNRSGWRVSGEVGGVVQMASVLVLLLPPAHSHVDQHVGPVAWEGGLLKVLSCLLCMALAAVVVFYFQLVLPPPALPIDIATVPTLGKIRSLLDP